MKSTLIPSTLVVVTAIILAIPAGQAQNIGFSVGIAAPASPVIGPVASPILPFRTSPIAGIGIAPIVTQPVNPTFPTSHFRAGFPAPPQRAAVRRSIGGRHGRPNVIAPGATVYAPGAVIVAPAPVIINNSGYVGPDYYAAPPTTMDHSPVGGLSRGQVITRFGHPSVSIVTRSAETLHYPNGVVIVIENGFVVTR